MEQFLTAYDLRSLNMISIKEIAGETHRVYLNIMVRGNLETLETFVINTIEYPSKDQRTQISKSFYKQGKIVNPREIAQVIFGLLYVFYTYFNQEPLKYATIVLKELIDNYFELENCKVLMGGKNGLKKILKLSKGLSDPIDFMIKLSLNDLAGIGFNQAETVVIMAIIFAKRRKLMQNKCSILILEKQLSALCISGQKQDLQNILKNDLQHLKILKQEIEKGTKMLQNKISFF